MATLITALALAAVALVPVSASAAPVGCGGKPGSPDRGALLQYCPQDSRSIASGGGGTAAPPSSTPSSSGAAKTHGSKDVPTDRPNVPAVGYPSSDGINFLLLALVILVLSLAVAYGARRWRRGRPQTS